jgi:Concanavalin A-like lectin/glucanases superfamily
MKRILFGTIAVALAAAMGTVAVPALTASASATKAAAAAQTAAAQTVGQVDGNVSSAALSSWETDGIVFSLVYGNGVIYAGGTFGNALPPGTPAGTTTGEVPRTFIAAFNSTTGALITSFDPTITYSGTNAHPGVFAMALSPDGSTLYIGGIFDHVNGVAHSDLAALSTSTGALTSWNPTTGAEVRSIAVSPNGSEIYIGGAFGALDNKTRTFAAAVNNTTGALLPWAPVLDSSVYALAVDPDDSQVLLGGYFQNINGVAQNSAGAVDAVTGTTNIPWGPGNFIPHNSGCQSSVKDIVVSGGTAYFADEGNGGGCFDGDWALTLGSTDTLLWESPCLGATQALTVINGFLFKGSHAHDCAWAPGGWPEVRMADGTRLPWHLLDQSTADGTIGHWTPDTNVGDASVWQGTDGLGPHAMATDGSQLFLGGDFTTVNNKAQQGIAIFPSGKDATAPTNPTAAPTVTSTLAGVDNISFPATSSKDVGTLSYRIFRDGGSSPIATLTATSWPEPGDQPLLRYEDTGLTPGSSHTYTYQAYDGTHYTAKSPASASVTVASSTPTLNYQQTVLNDNPSFLWPLNDTGGTAADASPNGFNGTYEPGTTQGAPGPFAGQTATAFDGQSGNVASANSVASPGPQVFSVEAWFNTTTIDGGKIVGFGNAQTGGNSANNNASPGSSNYDRHIYMMNDGQITFGVYNGSVQTIETPTTYNDGRWHYVVGTLGPSGMALYVDGQLIGTNSVTSAQAYTGFWRVGGDNLNAWNLDPWGSNSQGTTQPHSFWFNGTIADVAVYPVALSASQVSAHYAAALQQGISQ